VACHRDSWRGGGRRLFAVACLFGVALAAPVRAAADPEVRFTWGADLGLMSSRIVHGTAGDAVGSSLMSYLALSGGLSLGGLVAGVDVEGSAAWLLGRADGFTGAFVGARFAGEGILLQIAGEIGEHFVAGAGGDASHNSDGDTSLPYAGLMLQVGLRVSRRHDIYLGASAFLRHDLQHRQITATVIPRCNFFDFDCDAPQDMRVLDVGGTTFGLAFNMTWRLSKRPP